MLIRKYTLSKYETHMSILTLLATLDNGYRQTNLQSSLLGIRLISMQTRYTTNIGRMGEILIDAGGKCITAHCDTK